MFVSLLCKLCVRVGINGVHVFWNCCTMVVQFVGHLCANFILLLCSVCILFVVCSMFVQFVCRSCILVVHLFANAVQCVCSC